jgi:hypothetical protein
MSPEISLKKWRRNREHTDSSYWKYAAKVQRECEKTTAQVPPFDRRMHTADCRASLVWLAWQQ